MKTRSGAGINLGITAVIMCVFLLAAGGADASEWVRKMFTGLNLTRGDSDTVVGHLEFDAARGDNYRLNAFTAYGKSDGEKNVDKSRIFSQYRWVYPSGVYAGLGTRMERDSIAQIDYRLFLNPSAGKRIFDRERSRLDAEIGPSLYTEKVADVTDDGVALRVFQRYELDFSEQAGMHQSLEYITPGGGDFLLNAELGMLSRLRRGMDLRVMLKAGYDNSPAPGGEKYDIALNVSLGFVF